VKFGYKMSHHTVINEVCKSCIHFYCAKSDNQASNLIILTARNLKVYVFSVFSTFCDTLQSNFKISLSLDVLFRITNMYIGLACSSHSIWEYRIN
jgi:hypothetical protein